MPLPPTPLPPPVKPYSTEETLGVWLVGARGSVATMTMVCASLLARGTIEPVGLLTESAPYSTQPFAPFASLRFGGCDIRAVSLAQNVDGFVADRLLSHDQHFDALAAVSAIEPALVAVPEFLGCDSVQALNALPVATIVDGIRAALAAFKTSFKPARTIVVNVASTEEFSALDREIVAFESWDQLETLLRTVPAGLSWSVLYACAALLEGCAYINFTPSPGTEIAALDDLALRMHVPHAGKDGKTGETLIKTALAPVFEARALRVSSWVGYNILGNSDGENLSNPAVREAKLRSKDQQLRSILANSPNLTTKVGIDYVPSLGDWKTAWDFVHFEGILGAKMSLQILWQGADTILAAPLLLDLVRLVDLSWRRGGEGALRHLGAFFKTPLGGGPHNFWVQLKILRAYLGIDDAVGV